MEQAEHQARPQRVRVGAGAGHEHEGEKEGVARGLHLGRMHEVGRTVNGGELCCAALGQSEEEEAGRSWKVGRRGREGRLGQAASWAERGRGGRKRAGQFLGWAEKEGMNFFSKSFSYFVFKANSNVNQLQIRIEF